MQPDLKKKKKKKKTLHMPAGPVSLSGRGNVWIDFGVRPDGKQWIGIAIKTELLLCIMFFLYT